MSQAKTPLSGIGRKGGITEGIDFLMGTAIPPILPSARSFSFLLGNTFRPTPHIAG